MHAQLESLIRKQVDLTWQRDLEETAARTDEAISATIMRFAVAGQSRSSPLYKAVAKLASEEGKGLLLRRLKTATDVLHDAGEDLTPRWADAIASSVLEGIDAWVRERAPILRDRLEPLGCGAMCAPVEVLVEDLRRQIGREIEILKNQARVTQPRFSTPCGQEPSSRGPRVREPIASVATLVWSRNAEQVRGKTNAELDQELRALRKRGLFPGPSSLLGALAFRIACAEGEQILADTFAEAREGFASQGAPSEPLLRAFELALRRCIEAWGARRAVEIFRRARAVGDPEHFQQQTVWRLTNALHREIEVDVAKAALWEDQSAARLPAPQPEGVAAPRTPARPARRILAAALFALAWCLVSCHRSLEPVGKR